ncbi:MAG: cytochrome c maturation protein CcmE [Acidimicrobiia bacterium]
MRGYRWFVLPAVAGILVAGFYLVRSISGDLVYYLTTSEAVERRGEFPDGNRFRLIGIVVPGSYSSDGLNHAFEITDGATMVPVLLTRTPPPLFQEDVAVLLDGYWEGGRFTSDQALLRHEEDYQAPEVTAPDDDPGGD